MATSLGRIRRTKATGITLQLLWVLKISAWLLFGKGHKGILFLHWRLNTVPQPA
jgi:hypothetical protein